MTKVIFDMSMSLDGYVTAAGVRAEEPMGDGGQQLHEGGFGADGRGREVPAQGASIRGRPSPPSPAPPATHTHPAPSPCDVPTRLAPCAPHPRPSTPPPPHPPAAPPPHPRQTSPQRPWPAPPPPRRDQAPLHPGPPRRAVHPPLLALVLVAAPTS